PALIEANFPVSDKRGISGHSMGGHGALVCALKNPGRYQSVSAFSPITNPVNCPWGEKAFTRYLGEDRSRWREWDACALLAEAEEKLPILVDQGDRDDFMENQLKPEALEAAAKAAGHPLTLRIQPGYDHSYYFVASFIDDHLWHHAAALRGGVQDRVGWVGGGASVRSVGLTRARGSCFAVFQQTICSPGMQVEGATG